MNYSRLGHHHRLRIISQGRRPGMINLRCRTCDTTYQVVRHNDRYHIFNVF